MACFLVVGNLPIFAISSFAEKASGENQQSMSEYYSSITFVEYSGKGKFKGIVDAGVFVDQSKLPNQRAAYKLSPIWQDVNSPIDLTKYISTGYFDAEQSLQLYSYVNNKCLDQVNSLSRNQSISWSQSFTLSEFVDILPQSLSFSMNAKSVYSNAYGDLIIVTAKSAPYSVAVVSEDGKITSNSLTSTVHTMTVFSADLKDVLLSASICESDGVFDGVQESFSQKNVSVKLDPNSKKVIGFADIKSDIDAVFADMSSLASSVTITNANELNKLPMWTVQASMVGNIACTAANVSSEGNSNPVFVIGSAAVATGNLLLESGLGLDAALEEDNNRLAGIFFILGSVAMVKSSEIGSMINGLGSVAMKSWVMNPLNAVKSAEVLKIGNNFKNVFSIAERFVDVVNKFVGLPPVPGISSATGGSSSASSSATGASTTAAASGGGMGAWGWIGLGLLGAGGGAYALSGGDDDDGDTISKYDGYSTDGEVSAGTKTIKVEDFNSVIDDWFDLYLNDSFVGEVHMPEGGSVTHSGRFLKGTNKLELRLTQINGRNTRLSISINNREFYSIFEGSHDHTWYIEAN